MPPAGRDPSSSVLLYERRHYRPWASFVSADRYLEYNIKIQNKRLACMMQVSLLAYHRSLRLFGQNFFRLVPYIGFRLLPCFVIWELYRWGFHEVAAGLNQCAA